MQLTTGYFSAMLDLLEFVAEDPNSRNYTSHCFSIWLQISISREKMRPYFLARKLLSSNSSTAWENLADKNVHRKGNYSKLILFLFLRCEPSGSAVPYDICHGKTLMHLFKEVGVSAAGAAQTLNNHISFLKCDKSKKHRNMLRKAVFPCKQEQGKT